MEPVLLTQGKPVSEDDESVKEVSYTGLLVPEKIRLARRKYMYRWVLKVDDETRIPLKSNLKLMQELKKEELIDDFVTIEGKMRSSGEDKNVKYLIPDSITKGEAKNSDKKANNKNKSEQIADEQNLASGTNEIVASETLSLEDFELIDDANNGLDQMVSVSLKEWVKYGTVIANIEKDANGNEKIVSKSNQRASSKEIPKTITVGSPTTFGGINPTFEIGEGSLWDEIKLATGSDLDFQLILDKNGITNPNVVPVGTVISL